MRALICFTICVLLGSCTQHKPVKDIGKKNYGSVLAFSDNDVLLTAFESPTGKQFLIPRNADTIYFLKNAYTKNLIAENRRHQKFVKGTREELKDKGYWIVDRIIYNTRYDVVAIYGNNAGYFTCIIRNENGKLTATECNFIYDLFEYPQMKAEGFVN